VNDTKSRSNLLVSADGAGIVSRAGTAALTELADRLGVTTTLRVPLAHLRQRRSKHHPAEVLRDLTVSIADGGECLSDLAALRDQPELFGPVASGPTAFRLLDQLGVAELEVIRSARAAGRAKAWQADEPDELILDIDSTLVSTRSEKERAAATYKGGFGFHPLLCYLDATGEPLAGLLRPGNAGANTVSDHLMVLDMALAQIPPAVLEKKQALIRSDSAGASHGVVNAACERGLEFSIGFELRPSVQRAILNTPEPDWVPALRADESERPGAQVCELTDRLDDLVEWPEGTRAICRREQPHPGAQLTFTDLEGYRFQVFITNQEGEDLAALELRHRRRARCEDCIRRGKDTGLSKFPFRAFVHNQIWLELSLLAQDLLAFLRTLCLRGEARSWEPKRLRHRLLHVAARITRSGRRTYLRLSREWAWRFQLLGAFARLRTLAPG
jgi:Transposase DDE domain group 1